jgi:DNA-directed RNA polymerase specialized sigma24 family protein
MVFEGEVHMDEKAVDDLTRTTKALLLLGLQSQMTIEEREKPEVLLARAGFVAREIAEMLGKSQAAVAKALQRAGKAA